MPASRSIAVFADVHGNVPALRAVLADLEAQRPDEVLVLGDLVGRGPEGSRVVRTIAERRWPCLRGNHEDYLLDFRRRRVPAEWWHLDEWAASRWMAAELGEREAAWIDALPFELRPETAPDLLLVHGSPRSYNEGIGPWTSDERLDRHLDEIDRPWLVCAHTHRPLVRRRPAGVVVNVGAVGLPFNGDRRAQYAIFHSDGDGWEVEPRRVEYDVDEALAVYERSGFLAAGGVTAELLRLELVHAAPFLVPFQKWAALLRLPPEADRLPEFLDFYDPREPLHDFFVRLQGLEP